MAGGNAAALSRREGIALSDGAVIPRLGFGTLALGEGRGAVDSVLGALAEGYRLLDCARIYRTERVVGAAIAESGIARDELFVTTKVWNDRQIHGGVRDSVLESLDALGLEQVDLLLIHWPVPGHWRATWDLFQEIQREGLAASIGVSNFTVAELDELAQAGCPLPVVNQVEHHVHYQDAETLAWCRAHGVLCEAWAPFGTPAGMAEPVLAEAAHAHGASTRQIVLAWMMQRGIVPLPRTSSAAHARANAEACGIVLSEVEMRSLEALDRGEPRREHCIVDKPSPHD